ncbi:sensor histidine kinase [Geopsychrobacter electrodiphilus]|uniref:sensor histidine kinase n=1 Tax=Geopsychrobacter electrodiphilus TaxID=225196 RepID=UPI00036781E0|nr:ATP-binding protein [Geopsychrobacter electrodiphilus]
MFKSLISRIILFNVLLLALGVGIFTLFHLYREQGHLIGATRNHANMLLGTIEKSIFNSMRLGNTSEVQAILETVGHGHGITGVRIFNSEGIVLKSADPEEIGARVNSQDLELFNKNLTEGFFQLQGGARVLAMVRPIVSDERCFRCHGDGRRVIGVLNMDFSLSEMNLQLRETSQLFVVSTLIILAFLAAGVSVVMNRFLRRPLEKITQCMAQVEDGDLTVRMQSVQDDEIGQLMDGFNAMVGNLSRAQNELETYHYQQMERVDRLASVGEMAAGLAHEIKNPLAGISGAISVLSEDYPEGDQRREIMLQIQSQIGRLDKTVNDLLYFGKPGSPEFLFTNINDLIKQTFLFVAQHPESKNINRVEELTRDLPAVWIDRKQIQQVILNIALNAVQAMTEGGVLTVVTDQLSQERKNWVRIRIADTGPGITPEVRAKIFTPFFTTKTQGTGLGLPICRQLMEQNGGSLGVESELSKGAEFTLLLPVLDARPRSI